MSRRRPTLAVIALAAATLTVAIVADGSNAHADEHVEPAVGLSVSYLTGVLGPGALPAVDAADPSTQDGRSPALALQLRVLVENRGTSPIDQLNLVVEVFPEAETRQQLHDALDGDPVGLPMHVHNMPVREGAVLDPGAIAGVKDRFDDAEISWAADGGVHPVRIAVTRGTDVLDEVVTAVVWLAATPTAPLRTVFVWPIDGAPTRTTGGAFDLGRQDPWAPGGRLDGLVEVAAGHGGAPVVTAPAPHLLEELRDRANGFRTVVRVDGETSVRTVEPEEPASRRANDVLQRIRELTRTAPYPPVPTTYARANLDGLLGAAAVSEHRALAGSAIADSARRLRLLLDVEPDTSAHVLEGPVPAAALDLVTAGLVLIDGRDVDDPDAQAGPGGSARLALRELPAPSGRPVTALVADPYLTHALSEPDTRHGEIPAVQRVVADTALQQLHDRDVVDRTLLLLPRPDWDPGPAVAAGVLDQLAQATWLDLSSPASVGLTGRRDGPPIRLRSLETSGLPNGLGDDLARAYRRLDAVRGALPEEVTTVSGRSPSALTDELLHASSRWLHTGSATRARALATDVTDSVDRAFGTITVGDTAVTLTSDTGQIPVTLERTEGGPVIVRVEVTSQGRLTWPDGRHSEPLVLADDGRATVTFATRAVSTGTFPVTVRVTDPSGRHEIARTTLSVRSTAISGPAIAATAGVVFVLVIYGVIRRGSRRPRLTVVDTGDGTAPAE